MQFDAKLPRLIRPLRRIVLATLLAGLLGATMVRLGPGFDTDERELDTRLNESSREAIRAERANASNIALYYWRYLGNMLHGDLGTSRSFNQPVSKLLWERLPVTLESLAFGVAGGALGGFGIALATLWLRSPAGALGASIFSGLAVSLPAALIALLFVWAGSSGRWAISLAVFPHVYRYSKNVLSALWISPHVLMARAKGLSRIRVLASHVVVPALPQLGALAGVSVTLAFGASIPIEAICDSPGIGQLAWQAALGRDLPLLVGITLFVALLTITVNSLADIALEPAP